MLNLDTHVLLQAVGAETSLVHDVPLVTRDRKMLSSRLVPLA